LVVQLPTQVRAGMPTAVTVTAVDASNRVTPNYTGTVSFAGSTFGTILPDNYTFTAADKGQHTFQVTLPSRGSQSITVTDTTTLSITGTATVKVSAPSSSWDTSSWNNSSYWNTMPYWNNSPYWNTTPYWNSNPY